MDLAGKHRARERGFLGLFGFNGINKNTWHLIYRQWSQTSAFVSSLPSVGGVTISAI